MNPTAIDEKLRALQREYIGRLPQRAAELRERSAALDARWDADQARDLRRAAHNLAGSGATYGFPEVSRAARTLEQAVDRALGGDPSDPAVVAAIQQAVAGVTAATEAIRET